MTSILTSDAALPGHIADFAVQMTDFVGMITEETTMSEMPKRKVFTYILHSIAFSWLQNKQLNWLSSFSLSFL